MREPQDSESHGAGHSGNQGNSSEGPGPSYQPQPSSYAFQDQYSTLPQSHLSHLTLPRGSIQHVPHGGFASHDQFPAFNMAAITATIPQYTPSESRMSGASPLATTYDHQHVAQYSGQPQPLYAVGHAHSGHYPNLLCQGHMSATSSYTSYSVHQQRPCPSYLPQTPQYGYYVSAQYGPQILPAQQYARAHGRKASIPHGQIQYAPTGADSPLLLGYPDKYSGAITYSTDSPNQPNLNQTNTIQIASHPSPESMNSTPRGPPRKPKQSGHALWVGNLPPGTNVTDLKDHFSRDATTDIESLFLISKSNCAFVNYRTETSCTAAMHRFHDSRFYGVRLVCRLRRSAAPTSGVPTGPSAMSDGRASGPSPDLTSMSSETVVDIAQEGKNPIAGMVNGETTTNRMPEKFFIVKSLTMQDLEQSVQNGIWATQSHNEQALNTAYATADNVYLIFSANKSGEYFGFARMASPISSDASQLLSSLPKSTATAIADAPRSIPTPATEHAPKGKIIDDSARGTIFWEADLSGSENEEEDATEEEDNSTKDIDNGDIAADQEWGKAFKVEWISTNRLPFFKTRGLRNPWNANREVKIARDGTELETGIGRRLIQMFPRGHSSSPMGGAVGSRAY
ncbi:hypothetical protein EJ05DRAFT_485388 [Pseudovirgaria hyperparasitica]|uniref:YTH domain-containing protein n=1 Tax=Pseudovirgaria hyperparasitica TaxID=470096 RepID=A0A6A6WBL8_9PEZI|nr:uncharacterized protein EJ05DRAFT_485388 [Pseudovirgaria hyperparasitica]KAF2759360.1 hypothetical protein EJ05DRAFT_485388 [Pseudovirgaria hyperparasitica]